jgi:Zn-dependent peptidase ImmA (M78 family)
VNNVSIDKEWIENLAGILRENLKLDVPVDVEKIPSLLGGKLNYVDNINNSDIEAMISKNENSFEIQIKKDGYELRDRFSIAHELGHLFLHMGFLVNDNVWDSTNDYHDSVYYRSGYNIEENEANEFAGALLMPEEIFLKVAKEYYSNGNYYLKPIADFFKVSIEAVRTRGRRLGLFPWEG